MPGSFWIYLAEASVGLAAFALAYHLLFRKLTLFQWNRGYLIASLLLSLCIPLLPLPLLFGAGSWSNTPVADAVMQNLYKLDISAASGGALSLDGESAANALLPYAAIGYLLLGLYCLGCLYKMWRLGQSLHTVYRLIRKNSPVNRGNYILIHTPESTAPFSFLNYIFLHRSINALTEEEQAQVLQHEQVHVAQRHSLDLLLFELAGIFFWFNPVIYYLQKQIRELHEYLVDAAVTGSSGSTKQYGKLLIKLATQQPALPILNTFSSRQLLNRISMLSQPKSNPMQKFKFLLALPVLALTLFLCSFTGENTHTTSAAVASSTRDRATLPAPGDVTIRKITWTGNKAYTAAQLNKVLGIRKGDLYNKEAFNNRLNYNSDGSDVSSLYMDRGYLFFSVEVKEVKTNNTVDLELNITEGPQARIGQVTVTGNTKISTDEMLKKINIKPGELFSRSKLIKAQQAIIETGYFNPETVGINPVPNLEAGTVDIEFSVEEI